MTSIFVHCYDVILCSHVRCHFFVLCIDVIFVHCRQAAEAVEGIGSDWHTIDETTKLLPHSPGMFKLGFAHKSGVDVVFICHTTEHRTLHDMVLQVLFGFEGGTRLCMMVVEPGNRKKLMVQWTASAYPEDLIEDEIEEHIATHHTVPEYNIPLDDSKGIWIIIDEEDHASNTIHPTY
ncbi:uncharacterized protein LOC134856339 [Symsagittifera roscoffensis]|uniref:uncharacterized protein LOC134856339 n=1 Tax=Symsagittifera roscoffensis TaxID=84072 RepID=UPI00307C9E23